MRFSKLNLVEINAKNNVISILKNEYSLLLILFSITAGISTALINYSLFYYINLNLDSKLEITHYIIWTYSFCSFFIITDKNFISEIIYNKYKHHLGVLILPFIVITIAIIQLIYDYTTQNKEYLFLLISTTLKLIYDLGFYLIETKMFRFYFIPLEKEVGENLKFKTDYIYRCSGILMGTLFIYTLTQKPLQILYGILLFSFIQICISILLKKNYQKYITNTYHDLQEKENSTISISNKITTKTLHSSSNNIVFHLNILRIVDYQKFKETLPILLNSCDVSMQKTILEIRDNILLLKTIKTLETNINLRNFETIKNNKLIQNNFTQLLETKNKSNKKEYLAQLSSSNLIYEKRKAALLIEYTEYNPEITIIKSLLNKNDLTTQSYILSTLHKCNSNEINELLFSYINHKKLSTVVLSTLEKKGSEITKELEKLFYNYNTDEYLQLLIMKVLGNLNQFQFLEKTIQHPSYQIANEALTILATKNHSQSPNKYPWIVNAIEQTCQNIAKHMHNFNILNSENSSVILLNSISDEIQNTYNQLFNYLKLIYNKNTIQFIEDNFNSQNSHQLHYAKDIASITLSTELKIFTLPFITKSSYSSILKSTVHLFPQIKKTKKELLIELIIKNPKEANPWTKTCALHEYFNLHKNKSTNIILATIDHPEKIVSNLALSLHSKKNNKTVTIFQLTQHLSCLAIFNGLQCNDIAQIATLCTLKYYSKNDMLFKNENTIHLNYYYLHTGKIQLLINDKLYSEWENSNFIHFLNHLESTNTTSVKLIAATNSIVYSIENYEFNNLLFQNKNILTFLIENNNTKHENR